MSPRFARGAWRYALPVSGSGLLLFVVSPLAGLVGTLGSLLAGGVILGFHRDPDRTIPDSGIVAPADGRVSVVREEDDRLRVGIFMGLSDVHVNRAPRAGTVTAVTHSPGKHWPAFRKESDRNAKVHIEFETYTLVLIAGAVARRIHPYVAAGQSVDRGERVGHISFSSRVDVVLPPEVDRESLLVEAGARVSAGETRLVAT
jgi:phosphatidylserine decarboxylase